MRRSRGLTLAFLLIGVAIILSLQHAPLKKYITDTASAPIFYFRQYALAEETPKQVAEFDHKVNEYFNEQKKALEAKIYGTTDKKKLKILEITKQVLKETQFVSDDVSFPIVNVATKDSIPPVQKFDPRFTFGLILKFINDKFRTQEEIMSDDFTLPVFHWADYVDMSPLEEYIFKPEKVSCKLFDVRSPANDDKNHAENLFDPERYCIGDGDEMDSILQNPIKQMNYPSHVIESMKRIKNEVANAPALSTGFHIHSWTGRSKTALRPVISKSYLYDFMPVPQTIVFLLPMGDKAIQFNIEQSPQSQQRRKLRDSELFTSGLINITSEIERLSKKVSPTQSSTVFPYEIHLNHEDFIDNSAEIIDTLQKQQFSFNLNQTDLHYLAGLSYSLREDSPPKHFAEANIIKEESNFGYGSTYDWRFFSGIINKTPLSQSAHNGLLKAFLRLTNRYGIKAWIAHGSLLGWYWNGIKFPWEPDLNIQLPIQDFHKLTRLFNQSVVVDFGIDLNKETRFGRYFLDSGSFLSQRTKGNGYNVIDARFIDLDTGVKIDITSLAVSEAVAKPSVYEEQMKLPVNKKIALNSLSSVLEKNNKLQLYNCRKEEFIAMNQISPLRLSMVQGEYGYIPSGFQSIIQNEYSAKGSMSSTFNSNFAYLPKLRIWTSMHAIVKFLNDNRLGESRLDSFRDGNSDMMVVDLSDQEYIEFLYQQQTVFKQFLNTQEFTSLHNMELEKLNNKSSTKNLFIKKSFGVFGWFGGVEYMNTAVDRYPLYPDYFLNQTRYVEKGVYSLETELHKLSQKVQEQQTNWKKLKDEKEEKERLKKEQEEKERLKKEAEEKEKLEKEQEEKDRLKKEQEEKDKLKKEEEEKEKLRKEAEEKAKQEEPKKEEAKVI
nr:uncharacterized protein [Candida metapsilosis]